MVEKGNTDNQLSASELEVKVGSDTYTVTPASATSELFVALPGFSDVTLTLTATIDADTYTASTTISSENPIENGKYYLLTVPFTKKVHGFSIDPTHQIEFSHGNLQYKHSETKYHRPVRSSRARHPPAIRHFQ